MEEKDRKILVVYNICGIKREVPEWYIECIENILKQDFDGFHVVVSSCMNSKNCFKKLYEKFGSKISYCWYPEKNVIQVTFNKTVREVVNKYGEFEGYFYIDSGVNFDNQVNVLSEAYKRLATQKYPIVTIQTDTDTAFNDLMGGYIGDVVVQDSPESFSEWSKNRGGYVYETKFGDIQITGQDFIVPSGGTCNLHASLFSNEYWKTFDRRISPDVFVAFCAESTYIYSCKALKKDWVIVADLQVRHVKAIEAPCSGFNTVSNSTGNYWDNLFCGRSALEWMNDPEAKKAGLGYHNHPNAPLESRMQYDLDAYNEDGTAKYPDLLMNILMKYFFLTKEEFNYDKIKFKIV
tara:strand:+ start:14119 stop:15168 length:1050 start_codon:yes stop_codon:yes gene_type:complete